MGASVLTSHLYLPVLFTVRFVRLNIVSLLWVWNIVNLGYDRKNIFRPETGKK